MANNSLSSVVSSLVRAQMGTAVSSTVTDEDLDRHVAELILKEAKQKAERYAKNGIAAYLPRATDSNAPKANKRFLSSIIRSTDDHNKTILRAQAQAAEEQRLEREEQERRERKARAEEAVEAEKLRMRRLMGSGYRRRDDDRKGKRRGRSWERRDGRDYVDDDIYWGQERDRKRRARVREDEDEAGSRREVDGKTSEAREGNRDHQRRLHDRSRSPKRTSRRDHNHEHRDRNHQSFRRRRRSRSRSHNSHRDSHDACRKPRHHGEERARHTSRSRSPLPTRKQDSQRSASPLSHQSSRPPEDSSAPSREDELRARLKSERMSASASKHAASPQRSRTRSPTLRAPSNSSHTLQSRTRSSSRSPTPRPPPEPPKKAVHRSNSPHPPSEPYPAPPPLPSKMDRYFEENYDPRLDTAPLLASTSNGTINVPKTGLIDDADFAGWDAMLELLRYRREDKDERRRLERMGLVDKDGKKSKKKVGPAMDASGVESGSLMNVVYQKKGAVREWDMGKEGF